MTPTHVSAVDARRSLGKLLNIVSLTHQEIIIERAGKAIAKLVSCDTETAAPNSGKQDFRKARGLGSSLWKPLDTDAYIKQERSSWE
jgi:hypothetical protein